MLSAVSGQYLTFHWTVSLESDSILPLKRQEGYTNVIRHYEANRLISCTCTGN